jgi:uncharacterized protein YegP (UPF0339 family)
MATATKKARSGGPVARPDPIVRVGSQTRASAPIEFLIFEDNGGAYHWKIVGGDAQTLAVSGGFDSPNAALQAAEHVRDRASSAVAKWPAQH